MQYERETPPESAMESNHVIKCRILLVDSSLEMLALMGGLFASCGFDLIGTSTADNAVKQAEHFQPHAIYMGLNYHDCDGWELAKRLRKVSGMAHVTLVGLLVRGNGWRTIDSIGSHGFDYYLPKPPRMQDIISALTNGPPCAA